MIMYAYIGEGQYSNNLHSMQQVVLRILVCNNEDKLKLCPVIPAEQHNFENTTRVSESVR